MRCNSRNFSSHNHKAEIRSALAEHAGIRLMMSFYKAEPSPEKNQPALSLLEHQSISEGLNMAETTKKRTLDAFFKPPVKKPRTSERAVNGETPIELEPSLELVSSEFSLPHTYELRR